MLPFYNNDNIEITINMFNSIHYLNKHNVPIRNNNTLEYSLKIDLGNWFRVFHFDMFC